jgi:hypothetical protein
MSRSIRAVASAAILVGGLGAAGCATSGGEHKTIEDCYRNAVDTAWPDRYNYAARESLLAPFSQQAANGHFLDQTVWNWYFEPGSDRLTPAGVERLDAYARTTPAADPRLYIQTARDLPVTPDNADRVVALRDELNAKRAAAIKKYMTTQPGTPVAYEVFVHDAPVPGIYSGFAVKSWRGQPMGFGGGLAVQQQSGQGGSQSPGGGGAGGATPAPGAAPNNSGAGGSGPSGGGAPGGSGY